MNIKNCSTALFVKDISVSKGFYINVLEREIVHDFGKNIIFKDGFAIWEIQNEHIIPNKLGIKNITDVSINRFELYFESDDIDSVFQKLELQKVKFIHEIHKEPWGQRTFRFFDPDNHIIEIGESLEIFMNKE